MTALIVIASILGYLVTAGMIGAAARRRLAADDWDSTDAAALGFLQGMFWPVALPVSLGTWIVRASDRREERAKEVRQMVADRTRQLEKELGITSYREGRY